MRFEEAYEGWNAGALTQAEAAQILGMCDRSFRRYLSKYEADGLEGLIDRRLDQVSNRCAPVDEVMALTQQYRSQHSGWNVKHFHSWYSRRTGAQFWDALILATCAEHGVKRLYTEDFGPQKQALGVVLVNPFARR